jgi:hypothetical protein
MERAAIDRIQQRIEDELATRFPGSAVQGVALLQYGDDPEIEPGELVIRVQIAAPGAREGDEAPDPGSDPLDMFRRAHQPAIKQLRSDLYRELPEARRLEFTTDLSNDHNRRIRMPIGGALSERAGDLTPVMARLGPVDLETLDTLITTGIAANRADAVRWTLARIRERPAYRELRERARQIEELKTQF